MCHSDLRQDDTSILLDSRLHVNDPPTLKLRRASKTNDFGDILFFYLTEPDVVRLNDYAYAGEAVSEATGSGDANSRILLLYGHFKLLVELE